LPVSPHLTLERDKKALVGLSLPFWDMHFEAVCDVEDSAETLVVLPKRLPQTIRENESGMGHSTIRSAKGRKHGLGREAIPASA